LASDPASRNQLARSSAWAFTLIIGGNVLLFFIALITARALSLEGRGEFAIAAAAIQVVGWGVSGLTQSVVHHTTRLRLPESTAVFDALAIGLVGSAAVAVPGVFVALVAPGQVAIVGWVLAVAAPALFVRAVVTGKYLADQNITAYYVVGQIGAATVCVSLLVLFFVLCDSDSTTLAIIALLAGIVSSAAVGLLAVLRALSPRPSTSGTSSGFVVSQARFAALAGGIAFLTIANTRLDLLMVRGLLGADETAIYSVAQQIGEAAFLPVVAITSAATSGLGRRETQAAAVLAGRAVRHGVVVAAAAGVATSIGAFLFAAPVFGDRYSDVTEIVPLIALACVAFVPAMILATAFAQTLGRPGLAVLIGLSSLVAQAILLPVFIETWGETAAPLARAIACLIASLLSIWLFARAVHSTAAQLVAPRWSDFQSYGRLVRTVFNR
jgi:O-antigen/teichoic acid export membrane protein